MPAPIHIGASTQVASMIAERSDEYPGIGVRSQPMRYYSDNKSFSHMMGYIGTPSEGDLERIKALGRVAADTVGKSGIEAAYEKELMGTPGSTRMEVDSKRRPTRVVGRDAPVPGEQLVLGIDKNLQQIAIEALKGKRGAVVALGPKTGEVLCMASSPSSRPQVVQDRHQSEGPKLGLLLFGDQAEFEKYFLDAFWRAEYFGL